MFIQASVFFSFPVVLIADIIGYYNNVGLISTLSRRKDRLWSGVKWKRKLVL